MYGPILSKLFIILMFFYNILYSIVENNNKILPQIKKIEKTSRRVTYAGSIKLPSDVTCSNIHVCYKGKLIKVKNEELATFFIKDFEHDQINLLFVSPENLITNTDETNAINCFKIKLNSSYKFYSLAKVEEEQGFNWDISDSKLNENKDSLEIPLNTFIILADPEAISFSLDKKNSKKNSSIIELPKISIHSIKDKIKFEKSCLAYMNIKPFHVPQDKKEATKKNNVKVSILI